MQIQKNCKQMSVNRKLQHDIATGIVSIRIFILRKHFILIGINVLNNDLFLPVLLAKNLFNSD